MWSKLVASGTILLGPSFKLSLKRAFAIKTVVFTASKRTPLVDRQIIHVGFLFHFDYLCKKIYLSDRQVLMTSSRSYPVWYVVSSIYSASAG